MFERQFLILQYLGSNFLLKSSKLSNKLICSYSSPFSDKGTEKVSPSICHIFHDIIVAIFFNSFRLGSLSNLFFILSMKVHKRFSLAKSKLSP